MKQLVLALSLVLLFGSVLQAQRKEQRRAEIKQRVYERKVEFLKERVPMSAEEDNAFWPIYSEYMKKKDVAREHLRDLKKQQRKSGQIDYEKLNDMTVQTLADEANLTLEYYKRMKRVLPPQKMYLLFEAEKDFKKQLLDKVSGNAEGRD